MADPHYPPASTTPADAMAAISAALLAQPPTPRCCCGRDDCVFLKHNFSVIEDLEKNVHEAGKLGKALMARHEAFMASAAKDRVEYTSRIEQLEEENKGLSAENAKGIEDNKALIKHLESLNTLVADKETQITTLEAALQSSVLNARRLESATDRAEQLEREIQFYELEKHELQGKLFNSQSEANTAIKRWKTAERSISSLQQEVERMEREVEAERERHAEVVERMERQRAREKELDVAAGRLKGAAGARSLGGDGARGTPPAISKLVRDLLEDNANLQKGINELRDLLMNSNDEVQMLRHQLIYHQPVADGENSATSTLRAELEATMEETAPPQIAHHAPKLSQELHIHHHHHYAPEPKKVKKKRVGLSASIYSPPARSPSTPPTTGQGRIGPAPATPALLSHGHRDSVSTVPSNRCSVFSEAYSDFAPSSVPTSPRSNPRDSMIGRSGLDEQLCTTPQTPIHPMSPRAWEYTHRKNASDVSAHSFQQQPHFPPPPLIRNLQQAPSPQQSPQLAVHATAFPADNHSTTVNHMGVEELPDLTTVSIITDDSTDDAASRSPQQHPPPRILFPTIISTSSRDGVEGGEEEDFRSVLTQSTMNAAQKQPQRRPTLHRAASHESIMSLAGGLDIHTLRSRPSQLTLRHVGSMAAVADTGLSAVTASATNPIMYSGNRGNTAAALRDSLAPWGLPVPRTRVASAGGSSRPVSPASSSSATVGGSSASTTPRQSSAFGRLVASWRPWGGGGGASSSAHTTPKASASPVVVFAPAPDAAGSSSSSTATATAAATAPAAEAPATPRSPIIITTPAPSLLSLAAAAAATAHVPAPTKSPRDFSRPTGINQAGAIPGFQEYFATAQRRNAPVAKVLPDVVDRDALREGLEGG